MEINNQTSKGNIADMIKSINNEIIDSFETLRNYDFYIAWRYTHQIYSGRRKGYYVGSPDLDFDCIKIFQMKKKVFNYLFNQMTFCNLESIMNDALSEINDLKTSYTRLTVGNPILNISINKRKNNYRELIIVNNNSRTLKFNIDGFIEYCSNEYVKKTNEFNECMKIFASVPQEMNLALEKYNKHLEDNKNSLQEIVSSVNNSLANYKTSEKYIEMYEKNPEYLIEKLGTLSEPEKEAIMGQIIKNTKFQANKKFDAIISEKYPHLIDSAGRKGIEK